MGGRQPDPTQPTWREIFGTVAQNQRWKDRQDAWRAHEKEISLDAGDDLTTTVRKFLDNWTKGRWALVGEALFTGGRIRPSTSELVEIAKSSFAHLPLESWSLRRRKHPASAVALVEAELVVDGRAYSVELRWIRIGGDGMSVSEWEEGNWVLTMYPPHELLVREGGDI